MLNLYSRLTGIIGFLGSSAEMLSKSAIKSMPYRLIFSRTILADLSGQYVLLPIYGRAISPYRLGRWLKMTSRAIYWPIRVIFRTVPTTLHSYRLKIINGCNIHVLYILYLINLRTKPIYQDKMEISSLFFSSKITPFISIHPSLI